MKVSILIPVYNEARTCRALLEAVLAADCAGCEKEILVVESNSTDGTQAIVREYESKRLLRALYEDRPRGKGHALKAALGAATGDIVLIQDADLEYKVSEYPALLKPILDGRADFVLGSRHLGANTWQIRKFITNHLSARVINLGGLLYTTLFNVLYGVKLTDPATMFKVFRRACLEGVRLRSNWFELDWEIVAKLVRKGHLPQEVPVSYASRSVEEGKKIRFWRDGPLVFWAILRVRFFP